MRSAYRGQGYASEAVNALLEHAFRVLKVARVFAITDRENENSVRLMKRVGMRVASNPDASVVFPGFAGVIENPNLSLENKP